MHYSNIDSVHKVHLYFAAIGVNTCEGQSATEIFGLAAKHEISTSLHPYQETPTHEKKAFAHPNFSVAHMHHSNSSVDRTVKLTHLLCELVQPPLTDKQNRGIEYTLRKLGSNALVKPR